MPPPQRFRKTSVLTIARFCAALFISLILVTPLPKTGYWLFWKTLLDYLMSSLFPCTEGSFNSRTGTMRLCAVHRILQFLSHLPDCVERCNNLARVQPLPTSWSTAPSSRAFCYSTSCAGDSMTRVESASSEKSKRGKKCAVTWDSICQCCGPKERLKGWRGITREMLNAWSRGRFVVST